LIDVRNIIKNYTIDSQTLKAVDGVSFSIKKGEVVSIIGHSGSGKTTLLSLIGGLTRPDSGEVLIDDTNIWSMGDNSLSEFRNRKMSFIYQFASLIPTLTCLENVMLPTAFGHYGADTEEYAMELLGLVGLKDKTNSYTAHLSGGQQRRVAIARAFINRPEIVLADEPTGDLDEASEEEIIRLFARMNSERQVTFIIVTHNKDIASKTQRQLTMSNGVVTELSV
jgi:ABC-type lipoprotein export system ATPase subunit